jgi:hypothetical protein
LRCCSTKNRKASDIFSITAAGMDAALTDNSGGGKPIFRNVIIVG